MKLILCLIIGYLLGTLSPAALFGKLKRVDLKSTGSKNLGASNAWISLGKSYFFIIMVLDIFKSWLAAQIAWWLCRDSSVAGYVASLGAVLGHIFPFYLKFKGGKGLAALGGMACIYSFWLLVFYLIFGFALVMLFNHSWVMPAMIVLTFPVVILMGTGDWGIFAVVLAACVIIAMTHWSNMVKALKGADFSARNLVGDRLKNKNKE